MKKEPFPLIIAHRGASVAAPENTLSAFKAAIELGADGLEFDVRLARDGVPVVIHDATLKRVSNSQRAVSDLTAAQLAEIDVGSWFWQNGGSPNGGASETVPTLAKALETLAIYDGLLFIELKCSDDDADALTAAVCEILTGSQLLPQIILKSFKLSVVPRAKALLPSVRVAALFAPKIMTVLRKEKHLVKIAKEFGADELSIHYSLATRKLAEKAAKHGLPVNVWTADNPRWVKRALRLGLKSIITNDPAKLLARRQEVTGTPA